MTDISGISATVSWCNCAPVFPTVRRERGNWSPRRRWMGLNNAGMQANVCVRLCARQCVCVCFCCCMYPCVWVNNRSEIWKPISSSYSNHDVSGEGQLRPISLSLPPHFPFLSPPRNQTALHTGKLGVEDREVIHIFAGINAFFLVFVCLFLCQSRFVSWTALFSNTYISISGHKDVFGMSGVKII